MSWKEGFELLTGSSPPLTLCEPLRTELYSRQALARGWSALFVISHCGQVEGAQVDAYSSEDLHAVHRTDIWLNGAV